MASVVSKYGKECSFEMDILKGKKIRQNEGVLCYAANIV